jgi:diguanylate cyclase (GGDEF)-like protein
MAEVLRFAKTAVSVNTEWVVVAEPVATRAADLADLFKSAGFGVKVVRNGDEIGPLLERVPPPVLLVVHLTLPVVDGLAVLQQLVRRERKIPVLALTSVPKLREAAMNLGMDVLSVLPSESPASEVARTAARLLGRDSLRAVQTKDSKTLDANGSWIQPYVTNLARDLTDAFETAFAVVGVTVGGQTWCGVSARPPAAPVSPTVRFLEWPLVREASEGLELLVIPSLGNNAAFRHEPWPPAGTFQGVAVMPMISRTGSPVGAACLLEFGPLAMDAVRLQTFEARIRAATAEIEQRLEIETAVQEMQTFRRQVEGQRAEAEARIAALSQVALRDPLTGLFNRRGGEEALTREVARLQRTRSRSSLLLVDIDHFKRINDTHGHASGDRVISEVAKMIQRLQRASDISVRWGGEEFLVVLPDNDVDGARIFGERVRAAVEAIDFGELGHVTISAGAAELPPGEKPAETIARADHALYAAKADGRNRVHRPSERGRTAHGEVESVVRPLWTELAEVRTRLERLPGARPAASETDASPDATQSERGAAPVAQVPSTEPPQVPSPGPAQTPSPEPAQVPSTGSAHVSSTGPDVMRPASDSIADVDGEPHVVPDRSRSRQRWVALGLLIVAIVAGGTYTIVRLSRSADSARQAALAIKDDALQTAQRERVAAQAAAERQIAAAREAAQNAQTIADVLVAPDLLRFELVGTALAPRARGQGLLSRSRGFVFTALRLPPAAAGSTYQLWLLTDGGPVGVGPVFPDATGRATTVMSVAPAAPRRVLGMTLTVEASGTVTSPIGPVVLTSTR